MSLYCWLTSGFLLLFLALFPCHRAETAPLSALWKRDALTFSGFRWDAKTGYFSPGANHWSADNVWVDAEDRLHLRLSEKGGVWHCAEVSAGMFGYGLYRFYIDGPVNHLDKHAVLGLFLYPGPQLPFRANAEIDIEFARWGNADAPAGHYTVTPATWNFSLALQGNLSTHQFVWLPDRIEFSSYQGHGELSDRTLLGRWEFRGDGNTALPVPPLQLHINYWLFQGNSPAHINQPEIVIRKFVFHSVPGPHPHQRVVQETE